METTASVLKFEHVCKSFPGVQALQDVSFSLDEGEVLALVGENGAGKSTLVKCLTGAYTPSSGSIEVFGTAYDKIGPKLARDLGISAVYQEFNLVPKLPIVENIFMGNNPGNGIVVDYKAMLTRAKEVFDFFGVDIDPKAIVNTLSPAMMQIVEIAKAIVLELKILILDEPTAPLTANEAELLFNIIASLKKKGLSVLYISHRLEEIFQICDRIVVLRDGTKVAEKKTSETDRQELVKLMIGRELTNYYPPYTCRATDEVVLSVQNVSGNGDRNISFDLHKGEILGFAGLVGAGRTELMSLLFCDVPKTEGTVTIDGLAFTGKQPWHVIAKGVALIPEDRKRSGLLLDKSVGVNLSLAAIKSLSNRGVIDVKREKECVDYYCEKLQVKTPSLKQEVQYLSGGNQQKVIVAKWLATKSRIIIFDEPTRGIDVGTKHEIYEIINQLVDEGCSVLMVSSEFEELMGVADRIAVMCEGELVDFIDRNEYNKEALLDMASGKR